MLTKRLHNGITWIDIESPSKDEVRRIMSEHHLHPLVANEMLVPSLRDRVDVFPEYLYLILHFPVSMHRQSTDRDEEIDFIIGKDFLISAHYREIGAITEFAKLYEIEDMLGKGGIDRHGGLVFYYLLRKLYEDLARDVDGIENELDVVAKRVFAGEEGRLVRDISNIQHQLLNVRHVIRPHRSIFESIEFETAAKTFFGKDALHYIHSIGGEYEKIQSALEGAEEMLASLHDTNDSLLTTKTNEIMKRLTIMSFTVLPMTLIASLFGMSSEHLPFMSEPSGPLVVFLLMIVAAGTTLLYFRRKKWI